MCRTLLMLVAVVLAVSACSGGATVSEYAAQVEGLVTELISGIDTLDAEWESETPTLNGANRYWDRRLEIRDGFLEGFQGLDPPEEATDLHEMTLGLFSRVTAAEHALAARVATLDFEGMIDHGPWWNTPEGEAARAVDQEAVDLCHAVQQQWDNTEIGEAFDDVPWIPPEMQEVVQVAFGCPE